MPSRYVVLAACLAVAFPALAQNIVTAEQQLSRTVPAGRETRIRTHATTNPDCTARMIPRIEVTTPPAHGTTSTRPDAATVSFVRPGAIDCRGRKVDGVGIWYTPAPGYLGPDHLAYTVSSDRDRVPYEVDLTVR